MRISGFFILLLIFLVLLSAIADFLPDPLGLWISNIAAVAFSLACPLFFLLMILAPGSYMVSDRFGQFWERMKFRRAEIDDLRSKIHHLDKAHHMRQLGDIYFRQGRFKTASNWFSKALEKEPDQLDACYKLGVCMLRMGDSEKAVELLEKVHSIKPEHDYGSAYLSLARSHETVGNFERAREIYANMLKFYPGNPEACYHYGLLQAHNGDRSLARAQMDQVVMSVRNSPAFQRRRNRHWMWKARWWLLRNRD